MCITLFFTNTVQIVYTLSFHGHLYGSGTVENNKAFSWTTMLCVGFCHNASFVKSKWN